ncbi:MAG: ABC transporter permease [Chloroflexi bacterium]|nr:ABC transporter permease [Chloroflexota bacterium]
MEDILFGKSLIEALRLILQADTALANVIAVSLQVVGISLVIASALGIPLGIFLGLKRFVGKRLVIALLYTGMGFPPVVVGLFVYMLLSRSGPLGQLGSPLVPALYSTGAMIMAQIIISFPLVAGFTMAAVLGLDSHLRLQLHALGATSWQALWTMLVEARVGVLIAVIAGFGSIISEVGAVMMVGGNIEGSTRTLTTAIVLETRKGEFSMAMALGLILLLISFIANAAMLRLQGKALDQ